VRIYAVTAGNTFEVVRSVAEIVDVVVVRELVLPDWVGRLDPARTVLHARMAGALARARQLGMAVHLPDDGRPVPALPYGRSTHTDAAAKAALAEGARYVFLSPNWAPSYGGTRVPLGPAVLRGVAAVARGGVTPERVAACGDAGCAVLGGIFGAEDPEQAAARYAAGRDRVSAR
jgi:thiamine monophosphate synthase